MKLDIYGRVFEVSREDGERRVYRLGQGLKTPSNDISIPAELSADQIVSYLEDLLHEAAIADKPRIQILD